MRILVFSAAAAIAAIALPAAAATIVNGSFEQPGGSVRDALTTNYLPGWTYTTGPNGSLDIYEDDNEGDGLAAADGSHYVSFGHNGTNGGSISQTFAVTAGDTYTIRYSVAEQQGDDATQVLEASVVAGGGTTTADNSALTLSFLAGTPLTFTAVGNTATLTFLDATPAGDGAGSNLALDAVGISGGGAPGVPEPAAWAMMLFGFAGIGAAARRRSERPLSA
ncbi:MAG: PEPxxWA-CTERM sorting domain-containing protein [Caulobacteraceae bacterium]